MGVYIKGMEMPKPKLADMATIYNAYILVDPNGRAAIVVDNEDGLDSTEYSLVPVPPHGRLIDAYELFKEMERKGWFDNADRDKAEDIVLDAPTIIPADADEERREYDAQVEAAKYCEMYEPTYNPETGAM